MGGLDNSNVFAVGRGLKFEERVPDEALLTVGEFAAGCVEEDQSGIEAVAVAGGVEIEVPAGVLGGAEAEEVKVAIEVEASEDGGGEGDGLGIFEDRVRFGFEDMREGRDAKQDRVGGAAVGDHVENMVAEGSAGRSFDIEREAGGRDGGEGGGGGARGE
jgi:hypothetical protein